MPFAGATAACSCPVGDAKRAANYWCQLASSLFPDTRFWILVLSKLASSFGNSNFVTVTPSPFGSLSFETAWISPLQLSSTHSNPACFPLGLQTASFSVTPSEHFNTGCVAEIRLSSHSYAKVLNGLTCIFSVAVLSIRFRLLSVSTCLHRSSLPRSATFFCFLRSFPRISPIRAETCFLLPAYISQDACKCHDVCDLNNSLAATFGVVHNVVDFAPGRAERFDPGSATISKNRER